MSNTLRNTQTDTRSRWRQASSATTSGVTSTKSTSFASTLSTSSTASTDASSFDPAQGGQGKPPFLDAAASALGMTSDQLDAKLKSGESLTDIAKEKGVSTDTLKSAISKDFKSKHPNASDSEASSVADRVMSGPPGPPPSASTTQSSQGSPPWLGAAARSLGLSTDELSTKLASGQSLSDIAKTQGVSTDTLQTALAADFTSSHPNASSTDATTAASQVLSGATPSSSNDLRSFKVSELQLQRLEP